MDGLAPAPSCRVHWKVGADRIAPLLEERGIPYTFVNRERSLNSSERQRNRTDVVTTVRRILSNKGIGQADVVVSRVQAAPARTVDDSYPSAVLPREDIQGMNAEGYVQIFNALDFYGVNGPNDGKLLRHKHRPIPRLYFNRNRAGDIYFVGYLDEESRFPRQHWDRIPPQKGKDDKPNLITIVPKAGRERASIADLLT